MDTIRKSLSALREAASRPLPERDLPEIVIYGAGNCG